MSSPRDGVSKVDITWAVYRRLHYVLRTNVLAPCACFPAGTAVIDRLCKLQRRKAPWSSKAATPACIVVDENEVYDLTTIGCQAYASS